MKKTRRFIIFYFLMALISCPNHLVVNNDNDTQIPDGMGYIILSVQNSNGRTIIPSTVMSEFQAYTIFLYAADDPLPFDTIDCTFNELSDPIYLDPGFYDLKIIAYMDTARSLEAAEGELKNIRVVSGDGESRDVILYAIYGTGTGNFIWNIVFPSNVTANLHIEAMSQGGSDSSSYSLTSSVSGSTALNSGYYNVVIELTQTNYETIIWRQILHIYQNMESFFPFEFTDSHFNQEIFTVTFVYNNGFVNGLESYNNGDSLQEPPQPPPPSGQAEFLGWFADNGTFNSKIVFPYTVNGNIIFYAGWHINEKYNYSFNVNWQLDDNGPVLFSGNTPVNPADVIELLRGSPVNLIVINTPFFDIGSVKWIFNTTQLAEGAFFTLDALDNRYNLPGTKILTVTGERNGVKYSTVLEFNIVPSYAVTFDYDNGEPYKTIYVKQNDYAAQPADPVKTAAYPASPGLYLTTDGYNCGFTGWYDEDDIFWDFDTMPVTQDMILKADWDDPVPIPLTGTVSIVEQAFTYVNTTTNAARGSYTLLLSDNIGMTLTRSLSIANARLSIESFGGTAERIITYSGSTTTNIIAVSNISASLTLGSNITLTGTNNNATTGSALVSISNGTITMKPGSKIAGFSTAGANGAVLVSGGTFRMEGGEISGNTSTNTAAAANGGVTISGGTFNMSGGSISGNLRNTSEPGDVYITATAAGALTLSENSNIGVLTLVSSGTTDTSLSTVTLNRWTGRVNALNLRAAVADLDTVINYFINRQLIRAAGAYIITAEDISRITVGNFISTAASDNTRIISNEFYICDFGTSAETGVLRRLNAQTPVIEQHPASATYIWDPDEETIAIPLTITARINDGGMLSYQWYKNSTESILGATPVGEDKPHYTPDITETGGAYFYCVVTNSNPYAVGDKILTVTSNFALIRVDDNLDITAYLDMEGGPQNQPCSSLEFANKLMIEDGTYTIRVVLPVSGDPIESLPITILPNRHVTIVANDPTDTVEIKLSDNGSLFTVSISSSLTLGEGITLIGRDNNTSPLITVNNYASLIMEEGSKITKNERSSGNGGGVMINANGTFKMNGGEVSENKAANGGGIYFNVSTSSYNTNIAGSLTLSGGKIYNNTAATNGGGIYYGNSNGYYGGDFIMNGGEICNNSASNGGGVYLTSYSSSGSNYRFTMNNGEIYKNTAWRDGGGVYKAGAAIFNMYGGEIKENLADSDDSDDYEGNGGGVFIAVGNSSGITLGGSAKIIDNLKGMDYNNLFLGNARRISFATGSNPLPTSDMEVGVSGMGVIASALGTTGYENYFFADDNDFILEKKYNDMILYPKADTDADVSYVFFDLISSGSYYWYNARLTVFVNNVQIANLSVSSNIAGIYFYSLPVNPGDTVRLGWTSNTGDYLFYNNYAGFVVYYPEEPPNSTFTTSNTWSADNVIYSRRVGLLNNQGSNTNLFSITIPIPDPGP